MNFTYGIELEIADIMRDEIVLPKGCKWAIEERAVCNSDGSAWDCRKTSSFLKGGEINTPPTESVAEQVKVVEKCLKLAEENIAKNGGNPLNYRTLLHTHVGIPKEDITLENLKKLQNYGFKYLDRMKEITGYKQLDLPMRVYNTTGARNCAEWKNEHLMNAKDVDGFREAYFFNKAGKKAHITFYRQGFNVYSLFKHGTVEFRLFWQSMDIAQMKTALEFSSVIMEDALGKQDSFDQIEEYYTGANFPPHLPYDEKMEEVFQNTKW